jgi:hypothetical protein
VSQVAETAHAAARGAIAAMAMSGFRIATQRLGLVEETPPQAVAGQRKARGLLRRVPRKRRLAAVELLHWGVGAGAGAAFGLLPDDVRRAPWAGPVYGLAVLSGYTFGAAPLLGLSHSRKLRPQEHLALAADHVLYGLVLSEFRERPRD